MAVEQKATRKLRAILSADVKGYSRLMSDDESHTIRTLKECRKIMSEIIQTHSGRVVDTPGDNLLAEFSSIVNAILSAVEIQKTLKQKNANIPYDKKLEFRIGVNIGDVVQDGGSLYGEGVNIAARIEGLADPGGVCISRGAYDHIRNKLKLGYEYIGEHSVKNIKNPVRVYKLLMAPEDAGKLIGKKPKSIIKKWAWTTIAALAIVFTLAGYQFYQKKFLPEFEPASLEKMALPLPKKPSIAVLPFDNMSGDHSQDYFCDGISEEIITTLSKIKGLFVIARNSSFYYKGKDFNIKGISEELGVRYVLEGSVRKHGDQIRITAQLIDATKGEHLWAESYDRDSKNIFHIQDDITMQIVTALQIELTDGEQARIIAKQVKNADVFDKVLQVISLWREGTKKSFIRIGQLSREIIDAEPESPIGYRWLGWHHYGLATKGESPRENIGKAFKSAQKALSIDKNDGFSHSLSGSVYLLMRKYENAITSGQRAVELQPNGASAHVVLGSILGYAGRFDEAIAYLKQAHRLNPYPSYYDYYHLGRCYMFKGQLGNALKEFKKVVHQAPEWEIGYLHLAITYIYLNRHEEAMASTQKALELSPNLSVSHIQKISKYQNPIHTQYLIDGLRKAGFPEKPPVTLPSKPSIAVLPFKNISSDKEQEYFSDGLTIDIITDLAKISGLFVISQHSTFRYKNKVIDIQKVGKVLGVRYLLEGSVRRDKNRVRINAQLIDTINGAHLWSERYDRKLKDVFKLQNEILSNIVTALDVKLVEGEQAKFYRKATENPKAYDAFAKGFNLFRQFKKETNSLAQQSLSNAIELDSEYAEALGLLGATHWADARWGWSASRSQSVAKAKELTARALAIDGKTYFALSALSLIHLLEKDYDRCVEIRELAFSANPYSADSNALMAFTLGLVGREKEAIYFMKTAMRLSPFYPHWYLSTLCDIYRLTGQYDEAIATANAIIRLNIPHIFEAGRLYLSAILIELGREQEARELVREYLKLWPSFSLEGYRKSRLYKDPKVTEKLIDQLRKAGFPDSK